jgi:hypothetical protein
MHVNLLRKSAYLWAVWMTLLHIRNGSVLCRLHMEANASGDVHSKPWEKMWKNSGFAPKSMLPIAYKKAIIH